MERFIYNYIEELSTDARFKILQQNPMSLSDKLLLDYHRKTHMFFNGAIKRNPPNKIYVNKVVDVHDKFVKAMTKRGMSHNSPLQKI